MDLLKLIWMLLLFTPVAALVSHSLIRLLLPNTQTRLVKSLTIASVALLIVTILAGVTGVRFVPVLVNILMLAAAYFAYSFLAFSIEGRPWRRVVRLPAQFVAVLPIAYGYFMSSVGLLALFFEAGLYTEPPLQTVRLSANTFCVMTHSGWLDTGHLLRVHQEWPMTPILHRQTHVIPVNIERPGAGPRDCAALRGTKL